MNASADVQLLLIGPTGQGRSATGNSILGRNAFISSSSPSSLTSTIECQLSEFNSRRVKVVDGPGVGITHLNKKKAVHLHKAAMEYAIAANHHGYDVFLLVVRFGEKYTTEINETFDCFRKIFGQDFIKHFCILVVTCGDLFKLETRESRKSVEEWIDEHPGVLRDLMNECKRRVVLFDNMTTDGTTRYQQVEQLLKIVDDLKSQGTRYSDDNFAHAREGRKRYIVETQKGLIQEEAMLEANLILKGVEDVQSVNDLETKMVQLWSLQIRAQNQSTRIASLDNGTGVLKEVICSVKWVQKYVDDQTNSNTKMVNEREMLQSQTENTQFLNEVQQTENTQLLNEVQQTENTQLLNEVQQTENTQLLNEVQQTENTQLLNEVQQTENSQLLNEVQQTENTQLLNEVQQTENTQLLNEVQQTENSQLLNEVQQTENTQLLNEVQQTENSHLLNEVQQTENTQLLNEVQQTENTQLLNEVQQTENSQLLNEVQQTENSQLLNEVQPMGCQDTRNTEGDATSACGLLDYKLGAASNNNETRVSTQVDLLLIGKTGHGKSATGNSILRRREFTSRASYIPVTKAVSFRVSEFNGRLITIVDSPGFVYEEDINMLTMESAITINPRGYNALLLCFTFGIRFTQEEQHMIDLLKKIFGEDFVKNFCILVITGGDSFGWYEKEENVSFQEWCNEHSGALKILMEECDNRVVLFDNRTKDLAKMEDQIEDLLKVVDNLSSRDQRYKIQNFLRARESRDKLQAKLKAERRA